MPSRSNVREQIVSSFSMPPPLVGAPFVPDGPVEADEEQLAYIEAMRLDPFKAGNAGAERAAMRHHLHALGLD